MPRAGEAPQAQFKGLAYGENQAANDQAALLDDSPPHDPTEAFAPQNEEESFLYGPTDRPAEPLTAGAPFGDGPDIPTVDPTPQAFMRSVVQTIPPGETNPEVAAFINRVNKGL